MKDLSILSDREWISFLGLHLEDFVRLQSDYGQIKRLTIQVVSYRPEWRSGEKYYFRIIIRPLVIQNGQLVQIPASWKVELNYEDYFVPAAVWFKDIDL